MNDSAHRPSILPNLQWYVTVESVPSKLHVTPPKGAALQSSHIRCCDRFIVPLSDRLRFPLDRLAPLLQQPAHVTGQEQGIHEPPDRSKRRPELDLVGHDRHGAPVLIPVLEPVVVRERAERTAGHFVPEEGWAIERRDLGGEPLADAQVPRFPGDRLARPDEPGRASYNRSLAGLAE